MKSHVLSNIPIELPKYNEKHYSTKPYRYVYGCGINNSTSDFLDSLYKIDVGDSSEEPLKWYEDGCFPGEPIFVPHPHSAVEDEGVILSVVFQSRAAAEQRDRENKHQPQESGIGEASGPNQRSTSFLLALNATNFEEVARVYAPYAIPAGFHGVFV